MRKKVLGTMMILCCCLFSGCNNNLELEKTQEKENYIVKDKAELNEIDGVFMKIKKDTLTRTNATIIIYDYTDEDYIYGSAFHIDKKENGKWVSLKTIDGKEWTEVMWNLMAYYVDEHDRLEMDIGWKDMYGELPNGEYRIVKDTSKRGEMKHYEFSTEFVIR